MRKVVFGINITADGYCGHTDMVPDEESGAYFTGVLSKANVIVSGRITYQLMVPYWPDIARNPSESEEDRAFGRLYDSLEKVVFSTTLTHVEDKNSRLVRGNVAEEVLALKQKAGKDIFIGSLSIASQLSDRGLIDEYHFVIHPVLAGKGPRLFDTVKLRDRFQLALLGSKTFRSGAVTLHYNKRA
ncbi:MAG TPA: dihydrofolate reductase family protein [Bacteroidota bacterium]